MKRFIVSVFIFFFAFYAFLYGQNNLFLTGMVLDEHNHPLVGANIVLNNGVHATIADENGNFTISGLKNQKYLLEVSFIGYTKYSKRINPLMVEFLSITLEHSFEQLEEVVIKDNYSDQRLKEVSQNIEIVDDQYIKMNLAGSLMKSLERLPGVNTIDIGTGQSKPVIRGLSFNRVVVNENGIKHESQQWGADHGLEIDQYAVERVEVIKGPASLMYGSDAIGGVIDLKQSFVPEKNSYNGAIDLTAKSNNNAIESSAYAYARKENIFFKTRFTYINYGDYKIPADYINLKDWEVPLENNRMRNTAGRENNIHLTAGLIKDKLNSQLFVSNMKVKSGVFANAMGIEPRNADPAHNNSFRDILLPFQSVNHFKAINKTIYYFDHSRLETELGLQNNSRQEKSRYYPHGNMPDILPMNMSEFEELDREFNKNTYSANIKLNKKFMAVHDAFAGINTEFQNNRIGGRGFIIPDFTRFTSGIFLYDKMKFSKSFLLHAGLRYDFGMISTLAYTDWFETDLGTSRAFLDRAYILTRTFNNYSWSLGMNYNRINFSLKANFGKSFRIPIAKELAANGVNYHYFRYEKGDSSLSAEESYQFDLGFEWNYERIALQISPFVNYFPNYIYLNPSYEFDIYGEGNQMYFYRQGSVFRTGGEIHLHYRIIDQLRAGLIGEYLYSIQLSGEKKGFILPFSPAPTLLLNLDYEPVLSDRFGDPFVALDFKMVAKQDNIVPPEKRQVSSMC